MHTKKLIENMIIEMLTEAKIDPIHKIVSKIVEKYKANEVADSSRPAGPDTSKFTAASSGKISHERNVVTHPGSGMSPRVHDHFLKIGSGVDYNIHKKMIGDFHKELIKAGHKAIDYKGNEVNKGLGDHSSDFFRTKDKNGETYQVHKISGTNWGGLGISKKPL